MATLVESTLIDKLREYNSVFKGLLSLLIIH